MSIRKFGLIFILGLFLLSIGVGAIGAAEYIIVPTINHKGYYAINLPSTGNWNDPTNAYTDDFYARAASNDNNILSIELTTTGSAAVYNKYEFNVARVARMQGFTLQDITSIEYKMGAHGRAWTPNNYYYGLYCAVYDNYESIWRGSNISGLTGTWTHVSSSEANLSWTLSSNITNYINSTGILKTSARNDVSAAFQSANVGIYTDFVYLKITYNPPTAPAPTWGATPASPSTTYSTPPPIAYTCPGGGSCTAYVETEGGGAIASGSANPFSAYTLSTSATYRAKVCNSGTCTDYRYFTYAPLQTFSVTAPSSNGVSAALPFSIQWAQPSGGTGSYTYRIKVSTSSGFETTVVNTDVSTAREYTVSGLNNGTKYYIRIISTSGGQSINSSTRDFTVHNVGTPSITSPTNGATVGLPFVVNWSQVSGGTGTIKYYIKVGGTTYTPNPETATSYQVATTPTGSLQLQVMAYDSSTPPKESAWSSVVTVNVVNPTPTSIISPLQGAIVASPFQVSWTDLGGGYDYRVFLCDSTCGSMSVSSNGTVSAGDNLKESPITPVKCTLANGVWTYTSPTSLTNGPWVVRLYSIDPNSVYSSTYASVQLTVSNLVGPQVATPSAGQAISKVADVTWTTATGGAETYLYRVRICKNSSCSPSNMIVVDKTVEGVLTTNIPSGALDDGGYYYMQVQATENITGGATTAWSQIRGFSVTQSAGSTLSRPNILVPGLTGLSTTTAPTITWESIGNNITYTIQVADNALFASPVYTATTTSLSQTVPLSSLTFPRIGISAGRYYVRIMGANYLNQESPWSVVREFQYNTASTPVVLECSPACTTGQTCTNGLCVEIPATANEVRGTFVEVPKQLELGQSYFFKVNMMSTTSTTEGTFNVRIFSGATTLYTSSFTMQVSPQGDYKGITIDIPPDLEVPAGKYTIQVTDSRGVVVAREEVPLKTSTNPLDSIMGGDITTIAIVAGCAGLAIVSYIAMKSVFSKTKGKEKAAAKRVALRLRNSVKTKRKTPRRQAKVQKSRHQKQKKQRRK